VVIHLALPIIIQLLRSATAKFMEIKQGFHFQF
jgi:hypothetical protein